MLFSMMIERKKYGNIGMNISYEFNDEDFLTSIKYIKIILNNNKNNKVPWDMISYLISEIFFGGRITDDKDRRLILTLIKRFIN